MVDILLSFDNGEITRDEAIRRLAELRPGCEERAGLALDALVKWKKEDERDIDAIYKGLHALARGEITKRQLFHQVWGGKTGHYLHLLQRLK